MEKVKRIVKSIKQVFRIEIVVVLLTAFLVGQRDAYLQRENFLTEKRMDLINEYSLFHEKLRPLLIQLTQGYGKYVSGIENPFWGVPKLTALIPRRDLTAAELEEIKWEIRKQQQPVRKLLANAEQRNKISRMIQNYTTNPDIERHWIVANTAIDLMMGLEDIYVSVLWMSKAALDNNIRILQVSTQTSQDITYSKTKTPQAEFCKKYPMPLRIYFYQNLIQTHLQQANDLIIKEQNGGKFTALKWVLPIKNKEVPGISPHEAINQIYTELEAFGRGG